MVSAVKLGTDWAVWERFEIPNYDKPGNYLTRWRLIQTPFVSLYIHRLDSPDPRPTLHDHPWSFLSIIIRGGYTERRLNPRTMHVHEARRVRRFNQVRPHDAHAIIRLHRVPTWSVLLVGRRVREWGYLEPESVNGVRRWLWTPFHAHRHAREFDRAAARRRGN